MAPLLMHRDDAFQAPEDQAQVLVPKDEKSDTLSSWMIVVIIIGVLAVVTSVIFTVLYFVRRRRFAQEDRNLPIISSQQDLVQTRRKMSVADRVEAEELERALMIRKSLASRSSTFSSFSAQNPRDPDSARSSRILDDKFVEETEENYNMASNEDWKQWEAQAQAERRNSALLDPALQGSGHPALSHELQNITVPQRSRAPSPARSVRALRHTAPLPSMPGPSSRGPSRLSRSDTP
ncbi:hypothetical protein JX265_009070 [Neoarthrinium moseri]|uniref:Uncharacterized protein n=1 Tax=Neoarthrinium moseri TaxID=1658444 RepID=A0A9P9WH69_9PEZI|nr:uncharacterized protein JN550_011455 [Neoarthrinium moseri]KAI1860607.1 hypothetical protein JN550_011455 [Neoarthrinium moseri]KAI1863024.1 hypothetical protein JX265_009070 [Neoarthrinium moseri]